MWNNNTFTAGKNNVFHFAIIYMLRSILKAHLSLITLKSSLGIFQGSTKSYHVYVKTAIDNKKDNKCICIFQEYLFSPQHRIQLINHPATHCLNIQFVLLCNTNRQINDEGKTLKGDYITTVKLILRYKTVLKHTLQSCLLCITAI